MCYLAVLYAWCAVVNQKLIAVVAQWIGDLRGSRALSKEESMTEGVTVITGAASGMGQAAANFMNNSATRLLLCDIRDEQLRQAAASLEGRTPTEVLAGDIAGPQFPDDLLALMAGRPVSAFIHCAGLSPTMAEPGRILEVNLAATMRLVSAIRPFMAPGACAVLFASMAAYLMGTAVDEPISKVTTPEAVTSLQPYANDSGAAYSISKRGVQLLVRREAAEFGQRGARIVSISPGIIDTPMGRAEMVSHPFMKTIVEKSALRRAARPEEVAAVAVFLCSPTASFVTGIDVPVDGGAVAALAAG
jgi:NAD(P)-dependent dehydrogenase (short-subunit alcohol dehydrogenase family)